MAELERVEPGTVGEAIFHPQQHRPTSHLAEGAHRERVEQAIADVRAFERMAEQLKAECRSAVGGGAEAPTLVEKWPSICSLVFKMDDHCADKIFANMPACMQFCSQDKEHAATAECRELTGLSVRFRVHLCESYSACIDYLDQVSVGEVVEEEKEKLS
eukprot:CAMPEP_0177655862 /NCGR_PEP_ID=MMETSP0447-20121125/15221_1 /TAXON_ID=0 /ORGANISM="Stygamoeba regulata, Strain BSH-02190019" /LENGTH=158 /DNA_ID=CAMNT_0019159865 /DNA_START=233 /DNA_END=709 /DNA_ORIENTATION=+